MNKIKVLEVLMSVSLVTGLILTGCAKPTPTLAPTPTPTLSPSPASKPVVWNFSSSSSRTAASDTVWDPFAATMEKRTGGRFKLNFNYSGALLKSPDVLNGLKSGLVDIVMVWSSDHEAALPLTTLLNVPMLVPLTHPEGMVTQVSPFMTTYLRHPRIQAEVAPFNILAGRVVSAPYSYVNIASKKLLTSLDDFKGLKVRSPGGALTGFLKGLGATPVDVSWMDVYSGLQTGLIDAAPHYDYMTDYQKYYEVALYLTLGFNMTQNMGNFYAVNKSSYDALPQDIKTIFDEEFNKLDLRYAETQLTELQKGTKRQLEAFKQVTYLPAKDQERLAQMTNALWVDWKNSMQAKGLPGQEMLDFAVAERSKLLQK